MGAVSNIALVSVVMNSSLEMGGGASGVGRGMAAQESLGGLVKKPVGVRQVGLQHIPLPGGHGHQVAGGVLREELRGILQKRLDLEVVGGQIVHLLGREDK